MLPKSQTMLSSVLYYEFFLHSISVESLEFVRQLGFKFSFRGHSKISITIISFQFLVSPLPISESFFSLRLSVYKTRSHHIC